MPELPEVETLKRQLNILKGKTIRSTEVDWVKMVKPLSVKKFKSEIKGKKIVGISRRAKILLIDLFGPLTLAIHLKMTGQLIYQPKRGKLVAGGHPQKTDSKELPNKFTHVIFEFTDGSKLFFNDMRKFGWTRLIKDDEYDKLLEEFGIEPLKKEFTLRYFRSILEKYPNRNIKLVLMDQKLIAGLGNIYADESCFRAGIMPTRVVNKLGETEIKKLYGCIKRILKLAIEKKGTSFNTYVHSNGNKGNFVPYLKVYGRTGEKCKKCKGTIQKIRLNGRGTHFCKNCQK